MKKYILSAIAIVVTGCQSAPKETNDVANTLMQIQKVCPGCEDVSRNVLKIMHESCGASYSNESLNYVVAQSKPYALLLAVRSLDPNLYPVYLEAINEGVSCKSEEAWIQNTKALLKSDSYVGRIAEEQRDANGIR